MTPSAGLEESTRWSLADVLAVLVSYRQPAHTCATVKSLEIQIEKLGAPLALLVYDNGPTRAQVDQLPNPQAWSVSYKHDPTNPGVSAAYRAGADLARSLGKRWLLLLDQDTQFAGDALDRYQDAMHHYPDSAMFCPVLQAGTALISPCAYRYKRGTSLGTVAAGRHDFRGVSVLNSGMCIDVDVYVRAGGHDPAIALDFSDHDLVRRLQGVTPSFVVVDTVAEHGFSGTAVQDAQSAALRFGAYTRGALRSSRSTAECLTAILMICARSVLLSYRYRTVTFLRTAILTVLNDR